MDTAPLARRRSSKNKTLKTAAFHLNVASLAAIDLLVERDVFPSKSAAVDEALRLLRTYYADHLRDEAANAA